MAQPTGTPTPGRAQIAPRVALAAILALAAFLNLYRLDQIGINGVGNPYYAATVQSMLTSAHNLFYLSVDPAGFVSLDKPPLAFWIQAASARAFGFHV
jgi:4-amino-4-deoxy-L-arabinose transferase-like glycosyltransferase